MRNSVNCKCGNLHGTVEMVQLKLVLNSPRRKENGVKFQLAYNVTGAFIVDTKERLLRCVDCGELALTSADWQAVDPAKAGRLRVTRAAREEVKP